MATACGNCAENKRTFVIENLKAKGPILSLASVNWNYGDTATLRNIHLENRCRPSYVANAMPEFNPTEKMPSMTANILALPKMETARLAIIKPRICTLLINARRRWSRRREFLSSNRTLNFCHICHILFCHIMPLRLHEYWKFEKHKKKKNLQSTFIERYGDNFTCLH